MSIGIVETTGGKAQGIQFTDEREGLTMFRGIPYAKPPVGPLRWCPPQKAEPWEGVRVFDEYAPIEIQYQAQYMDGTLKEKMSEDCLYLNVTTPAKSSDEKLPVFVWFHGGGLTNGASYHDEGWEPYFFAKQGIVVVSIGHRVNIWGFMALPQLSEEQGGKSGNYGMMDLAMAMDWVWDNIEKFGGDRNNITAGGDSGGTQKTCLMASIPAGKGRIRRIYNSSGLKWRQVPFQTMEEAEAAGIKYLEYMGIDPNASLEELRAMDSFSIHGNVPRSVYPGEIIYDGDFVPLPSMHELFDAYLGDVDFVNVTAQGESNIFATNGMSGAYGSFTGQVPIHDAASFYEFYRGRLGDLYEQYDFENLIHVTDEDALYQAKLLGAMGLAQLASNNHSRNNMVNRLFGQYMKQKHPSSKVFSVLWSHIPPFEEHGYGTDTDPRHRMASHCEDVYYIFHTLHLKPEAEWTDADYELSDLCGKYWVNFVKTGDVNGEGLPSWPETGDEMTYLEVTDSLHVHKGLESRLEEMVCEYVKREYGLANGD